MEKYIEYERIKERYNSFQALFAEVLLEKERLLTKTLPNAIRYDREHVLTTIDGNLFEDYMVAVEDEGLEEKLSHYRQSLKDWGMLLSIKEEELRQSKLKHDRVYVLRIIEGYNIGKVARITNYSKSQIYRIMKQIYKTCEKMRLKE